MGAMNTLAMELTEYQQRFLDGLIEAHAYLAEHPKLIPEWNIHAGIVAKDADTFQKLSSEMEQTPKTSGQWIVANRKVGSVDLQVQIAVSAVGCPSCGSHQ